MSNLVVSKPENHNLRCKTALKIAYEFCRRKKRFFIADTKLQVDQKKRKMEAKFNKPLFIQKSIFLIALSSIPGGYCSAPNFFFRLTDFFFVLPRLLGIEFFNDLPHSKNDF